MTALKGFSAACKARRYDELTSAVPVSLFSLTQHQSGGFMSGYGEDVPPYQRFREGLAGENGRKQFKNKYVQSQYVYENKQISDKMPEKSRTFMS
jgi:hypothetical protein